ncbi:MAG: hypothetical protein R3300_19645 [Candidatus Promineifilaceae bacterium]|nr:hypothetical protein [Candidatus Promineifilaceae bacterium]
MAKIPEFLLRSLYVKGSLRHLEQETGFAFDLKNELGAARIVGVEPLLLDRKPIPLARSYFLRDDDKASFTTVSQENSVLMRKGEVVTVRVTEERLGPGRHTLGIHVIVKDLGALRFTVSDSVHA